MPDHGQEDNRLSPRVLVLGCLGPLGQRLARALALRSGHMTLHTGHRTEALRDFASGLGRAEGTLTLWTRAVNDLEEFFHDPLWDAPYDAVVNALGPWHRAPLGATSPRTWEVLTRLNLGLAGALVSHQGPRMAARGFGRIILLGSSASDRIQSYTTIAAYAATKTALGVVAKSAAREFGPRGVTCNVLLPGVHSLGPMVASDGVDDRGPGAITEGLQPTETLEEMAVFCLGSVSSGMNGAIISCGFGL